MAEVIDLLDSDEEVAVDDDENDPVLQEALRQSAIEAEQQKKRIMEMAASMNASKGLAPALKKAKTEPAVDDAAGPSGSPAATSPSASGEAAAPSNNLLASLHADRLRRQQGQGTAAAASATPSGPCASASARSGKKEQQAGSSSVAPDSLSLLTYNVWFNEQVALQGRMHGLGQVIQECGYPDLICLQEVTPNIVKLFRASDWYARYTPSPVPPLPYFTMVLVKQLVAAGEKLDFSEQGFSNSVMGRSLLGTSLPLGSTSSLYLATSHLESPCGQDQQFTEQRRQQAHEGFERLQNRPEPNIIWCGDMNWSDSRDGAMPLPASWQDAWQSQHPGKAGATYDGPSNPMLGHRFKGSRLDRVLLKSWDYEVQEVNMVGTQPLPGLTYRKTFSRGGSKELPVLVSDHFGLFMKLRRVPGKVLGR